MHTEEYSRDLCLTQRDFQLPSDQNHPCVSHMGMFREGETGSERGDEKNRFGQEMYCTTFASRIGAGSRERGGQITTTPGQ